MNKYYFVGENKTNKILGFNLTVLEKNELFMFFIGCPLWWFGGDFFIVTFTILLRKRNVHQLIRINYNQSSMNAISIISTLTITSARTSKLETAIAVLDKLNEMKTIDNMPYFVIRKAIRLQTRIVIILSRL